MGAKILIVDDEQAIADLAEVYLKNENYQVFKFYNGQDALECIDSEKLDLAILDVMLPNVDGFSICRHIREKHNFACCGWLTRCSTEQLRSGFLV